MSSTNTITLKLTASGIDLYCRELARRSSAVEKRVAELDALITFISTQTESGEQAKAEFVAIRQVLLDHFERARDALLAERGERLHAALQAQQVVAITALYGSLSRDAFWTLLGRVEPRLDAAALHALRGWAVEWLHQAQQRARQASRYPDAIDFEAAQIEPAQYLAMSDLVSFLGADATAAAPER